MKELRGLGELSDTHGTITPTLIIVKRYGEVAREVEVRFSSDRFSVESSRTSSSAHDR